MPKERIKQAYIPDVFGKERRKRKAGKEGKLGVEGMTPEILLEALRRSGATFSGEDAAERQAAITKADLLEKGQPIDSQSSETTATDTSASTIEGVTPMDLQYAQISVEAGKVRSNASTKDSIVVTLAKGDQVTVDGQKTGGDGKTWYHISAVAGDGSAYTGFVRSDLVTLGDMVPVETPVEETPEEPVEEAPVEEPAVPQDYEAVYTDDGTGNNVWYLYDHKNNSRMKLEDLLSFVDSEAQRGTDTDALASKLKIVVVILAVLLVAAIVAIILMALKLRDAMYEDYGYDEDEEYEDQEEEGDEEYEDQVEEEDEEDDDEKYSPSPRRRPSVDAREARATRDDMANRTADEGVRRERKPARPAKEVGYEEDDLTIEGAVKKPAPNKKKNFVIDDEDFSFEFLNMD